MHDRMCNGTLKNRLAHAGAGRNLTRRRKAIGNEKGRQYISGFDDDDLSEQLLISYSQLARILYVGLPLRPELINDLASKMGASGTRATCAVVATLAWMAWSGRWAFDPPRHLRFP